MHVREIECFEFDNGRLSFQRYGTGSTILLAFHGFGQDGQIFSSLIMGQPSRFTVIAIDLFFHGASDYKGYTLLTRDTWGRILTAFLSVQRINRFSLIGFSLGGRFALTTVEIFADRIDQLYLVASDGITRSFWYRLVTGSILGRGLFRYYLQHLSKLTSLGHTLTRLGFINRTVMRFVEVSLGTPQQRQLIYQSWTQFRLIQPDLRVVGTSINEYSIQTYFVTGAFDRIVPGSYSLPLMRRLNQYQLTILQTGHTHLLDRMTTLKRA